MLCLHRAHLHLQPAAAAISPAQAGEGILHERGCCGGPRSNLPSCSGAGCHSLQAGHHEAVCRRTWRQRSTGHIIEAKGRQPSRCSCRQITHDLLGASNFSYVQPQYKLTLVLCMQTACLAFDQAGSACMMPGRCACIPSKLTAAANADGAPSGRAPSTLATPARVELEQGRKWCVEGQVDNRQVVVDDTSPKQTVYIFACKGSTVQVSRTLAQARQRHSAECHSTSHGSGGKPKQRVHIYACKDSMVKVSRASKSTEYCLMAAGQGQGQCHHYGLLQPRGAAV